MKSENEVKVTDELIVKYLAGEATPEEAIALHDWLGTAENKVRFEELQSTWNTAHPSRISRPANTSEAWKKIQIVVDQPQGRRRFPGISTTSLAVAATIVLAIVAALLYSRREPSSDMKAIATTDSTRNLTLADNSRITLYHNTGMLIPTEFKDGTREVTLVKGEAYFAVAKNDAKPFVIHAGFANIRVVGTEFNVIVKDDEVVVGVHEGKVMFYSALDSVLIERGMAASLKPAKVAEPVDMSLNTWAYATRKLVFKDTPLPDVIETLRKTYGEDIRVANDQLGNCKVTAAFEGESLDYVVHLIAESAGLTLEKNGEIFILNGEGCP
jgi:ferric-dicitrate binding protein FerR (iron transport regulator)